MLSMTPFAAVLLYVCWTMFLALFYAFPRVPKSLFGGVPIDSWERDKPLRDPAFMVRAKGAHLNCLENPAALCCRGGDCRAHGQTAPDCHRCSLGALRSHCAKPFASLGYQLCTGDGARDFLLGANWHDLLDGDQAAVMGQQLKLGHDV
jgi:hypothetical protein